MKLREFISEAVRNGWTFLRQGKGSHEIYEKAGKTSCNTQSWIKRNRKMIRTKAKKRNESLIL